LRAAQKDLDAALEEHRAEQVSAMEALMNDETRCAAQPGGGWRLTLNQADAEMLLPGAQ
jgi:hypothetical protein